jgi:glutamate/aspartate transport system permease protein
MNYHWNWRIFWEESPDGVRTYAQTLIDGLQWTLAAAAGGWVIAVLVGVLIGAARTLPQTTRSGRALRLAGTVYIEVFRNIPLLVQMFLWYFVVPELLPQAFSLWLKTLPNLPFVAAVVALGLYTSARVAVQVTAGIETLAGGQQLAALALGLTRAQAYRYVLLPLALRIILPPLASECLNIIKNSAVALTIGLVELMNSANAIQEFSFQTFEAFTAATVLYVALNILVVALMHWLERHLALPGSLQAKGGR